MTIDKIRNDIGSRLGNSIKVIHNEGRNKIYEYTGKVVEVYDNVFIILESSSDSKMCFSYHDILIDVVKVLWWMSNFE